MWWRMPCFLIGLPGIWWAHFWMTLATYDAEQHRATVTDIEEWRNRRKKKHV